jgi:hypothetical protein
MATTPSDPATLLRTFLEGSLTGDADAVAGTVTEGVVGWSPQLFVTSRDELLDIIGDRDGVLSNVEAFIDVDVLGAKAVAEWSIAADHTGAIVMDDDLSIEPTGRRLQLAGVTIAEFDGERIGAFRHYFDDLALVEQALAP